MASENTTLVVGLLVLVLSSAGILITFDNAPIQILLTDDYAEYYVDEGGSWVLAAREFHKLKKGSKNLFPLTKELLDPDVNEDRVRLSRVYKYEDGVEVRSDLFFDADNNDVRNFPTTQLVTVLNGNGLILEIEIRELDYDGITRVAVSPESFGHKMKVEWESGAYFAKVSQLKNKDKLVIRYRIESDDETRLIKVFDPPKISTKEVEDLMDCDTKVSLYYEKIVKREYYNRTLLEGPSCVNPERFDLTDVNGTTKTYCKNPGFRESYKILNTKNSTELVCSHQGKVIINNFELKRPLDFCKVQGDHVECDACTDSHGGGADGDCSGSCEGGETCERINP